RNSEKRRRHDVRARQDHYVWTYFAKASCYVPITDPTVEQYGYSALSSPLIQRFGTRLTCGLSSSTPIPRERLKAELTNSGEYLVNESRARVMDRQGVARISKILGELKLPSRRINAWIPADKCDLQALLL